MPEQQEIQAVLDKLIATYQRERQDASIPTSERFVLLGLINGLQWVLGKPEGHLVETFLNPEESHA